jgi:hypothetical protein
MGYTTTYNCQFDILGLSWYVGGFCHAVAASPLIISGLQKSQRAMGQHVNALGVTLGDASDGSDFRSSIAIQDDAWDFVLQEYR